MIRATRPLDVARYGILGAPAPGNRAHPLDAVGSHASVRMSKSSVAIVSAALRRRGALSLTLAHDRYVPAIMAARPRASDKRCWDVTHLFADSPLGGELSDLYGALFQRVSELGGESLFLRLREDDPLAERSASRGFSPYARETLWSGARERFTRGDAALARPMRSEDEHDVFRLYNAATPARARLALGMTIARWRGAREGAAWRSREYVCRPNNSLLSWARLTRRGLSTAAVFLLHPDDDAGDEAIIAHAASRAWGSRAWHCLGADHQARLASRMRRGGMRPAGRYVLLTRSMATPVSLPEAARALRVAGLGPAAELSQPIRADRAGRAADLGVNERVSRA